MTIMQRRKLRKHRKFIDDLDMLRDQGIIDDETYAAEFLRKLPEIHKDIINAIRHS